MAPNCNTNNCIPDTRATTAAVAKVLNAAKVPNVLWGWQAVGLLGVDYKYPEIDIIVIKQHIKRASKALAAAGYTRCTDTICSTKSNDGHCHLAADDHFHSDAAHLHYDKDWRSTGFAGIRLYSKARLLWWIPDNRLETMEDRAVDALFMTTTDELIPELDERTWASGTGRWDGVPDAGGFRMLRPAPFFEALQLLMCLYYYGVETQGNAFSDMWCGNLLSETNNGIVQEVEEKLSPEFWRVWDYVKKVESDQERERDQNSYPVLRLRERLLTGNLHQSTYHSPLPVENRVGRQQLPELDVDPDYVVKRKRQG
ncbi:hypothetical protein BJX62DRAFT_237624 [Aspergillus germanicus]